MAGPRTPTPSRSSTTAAPMTAPSTTSWSTCRAWIWRSLCACTARCPGRVVHILRQACDALGEAHAISLIHRDIKPSNLLLCESGQRSDVVKLLDFGLVQRVASPTPQDSSAPALAAPAWHPRTIRRCRRVPAFLSPPYRLSPSLPPAGCGKSSDGRHDAGCAVAAGHGAGQHPRHAGLHVTRAGDGERAPRRTLRPVQPGLRRLLPADRQAPVCDRNRDGGHGCPIAEPAPSLRQINPTLPEDLEAVVLRCLEKQPNDREQCRRPRGASIGLPLRPRLGFRPSAPLLAAAPGPSDVAASGSRPRVRVRVRRDLGSSVGPVAPSPTKPPAEDIDPRSTTKRARSVGVDPTRRRCNSKSGPHVCAPHPCLSTAHSSAITSSWCCSATSSFRRAFTRFCLPIIPRCAACLRATATVRSTR